MFDNDILILWNQSINDWINSLNEYIDKTDYYGLYILGEQWTTLTTNINNISPPDIIDIKDYKLFISYLDAVEFIIIKLNNISIGLLSENVIKHVKMNMSVSYQHDYDKLIDNIKRYKIKNNEYLQFIIDGIDDYLNAINNKYTFDELFNIYESTGPHNDLTTASCRRFFI